MAWLSWVLSNRGHTERAAGLWTQLQAVLASVPDPTDRRYVHIKGMAGVAIAHALRGDTLAARAMAQELLDLGAETGNRRASAMGHIVRVYVYQILGDAEMVAREGRAAAACQADPIYVWLGEIYAASGVLGCGRFEEAEHLIEQHRAEPTLHGYGLLADGYRGLATMAAVAGGHVTRGMRELSAKRESSEAVGDLLGCVQVHFNVARALVVVARGELSVSKVKNPGLMLLLPVAARRGRAALDQLIADIEEHGLLGFRPAVEYELARLSMHQRRSKDARAHLDAVDHLLAAEPYAFLRTQVGKARAEL